MDERSRISVAGPPWRAHCEALYREHSARLVRLARLLLRDPQEAEEVAQEVFVKLVRACQAPDAPRQWGPWLTRVTLNACRDRGRAGWWRWRRQHVTLDGLEIPDADATPDRAALSQESRDLVWRAFRELPRRQREVFALRHVEGWSTDEVAKLLGLRPGSVKRHLFRAVRRLRAALRVSR